MSLNRDVLNIAIDFALLRYFLTNKKLAEQKSEWLIWGIKDFPLRNKNTWF